MTSPSLFSLGAAVALVCTYTARGLRRTYGAIIIGGYLAFVTTVLITS